MQTCKTCIHWQKSDDPYGDSLTTPMDPDTFEEMESAFEVRICTHPSKLFCERPLEANGFALADGSGYKARLATGEGFGCVRHEAGDVANPVHAA